MRVLIETESELFDLISFAGMYASTLSTLERRFRYDSTTAGTVSAAFNTGSLLTVLPFSYLAGKKNAPKLRYLSLGMFIMGLGSALYSLPHFISTIPKASEVAGDGMCISDQNDTETFSLANSDTDGINKHLYLILIAGHFLHGAGGAAVYPISVAYLLSLIPDAPNFIAVWPVFAVIGSSTGYATGSMLLKLKADVDRPALSLLSNKGHEEFGGWVRFA